ncbi:MAG TPA: SAM-dependent methyltransferase [Acetobacteraceae bacterium]|nr:SAM-dependent methyltransferase [Acetobacteraceae bacterium]
MMERLDAFMARANAAYYATHDPFADFTTAPEITQVFGELLGLWAAVTWDLLGRPAPVSLVEAGPGRGTLMADALRAVAQVVPAFHAALSLHLIETSPRLRALQADRLPDATWHDTLATVPLAPMLLLANEFLDALPIRQFVRRGEVWTERHVVDGRFVEQALESPPRLAGGGWGEGCVETTDAIRRTRHPLPRGEGESIGVIHELSAPAGDFVADLAARLTAQPGAAVILDYGPEQSTTGDSLQAIANGRPTDPLSAPGSADLTAHVDFQSLAAIARTAGAVVHGPIPQGPFLARLGLFQRTDRLAQGQPPRRAAALVDAAQRLAEPDRMGRLFKAMAFCHPSCPIPPGFAV